ncbi:MAG: hypothetical protein WEF50_03775 [Myxococcota bacterium]
MSSAVQEVNLFQPGLRPPAPALAARLILRAIGGLALALLLLYGFASQRARSEAKTVATLLAHKSQATARLEELEQQISKRTADPVLAAEVRELGGEVETRRTLVTAVEARALGSAQGFSPQLEGLAKRTHEGVWLHQIKIERGGAGLALAGRALAPELLPEWLEGMGQEAGLAGRTFQLVRVQRPDPKTGAAQGSIDFALATGEVSSP